MAVKNRRPSRARTRQGAAMATKSTIAFRPWPDTQASTSKVRRSRSEVRTCAVGPSATGNTALMVLSTDQLVPGDALERLRGSAGISDVHTVET